MIMIMNMNTHELEAAGSGSWKSESGETRDEMIVGAYS